MILSISNPLDFSPVSAFRKVVLSKKKKNLAPREEELLLSPFLIFPPSTCLSLVFFVFFRCFLAICRNSGHFPPPSRYLPPISSVRSTTCQH